MAIASMQMMLEGSFKQLGSGAKSQQKSKLAKGINKCIDMRNRMAHASSASTLMPLVKRAKEAMGSYNLKAELPSQASPFRKWNDIVTHFNLQC